MYRFFLIRLDKLETFIAKFGSIFIYVIIFWKRINISIIIFILSNFFLFYLHDGDIECISADVNDENMSA